MQNGTRLAAVDLGSNSFRLEIGRLDHGQIHRTEYLKETVRQGNGLDSDRNLTLDAMQRGWECLARFGERLAGFKKAQVRAVATQTLREARNREEFLARACKILGFPIDIISGREEARLIYQGVAHMLPQSDERRLVVDIGGRSTEIILGTDLNPRTMESYRVGSVAWSMKYFPEGQFTARAFDTAQIAAKAVLDEAVEVYRSSAWDVAYGSSGTIGAVSDILSAAGWPDGVITREGLDWLLDRLLKAQTAERLKLDGMKDDRRAVIGGGVSVLRAVFELMGVTQMRAAQGALRHGVLYDLLDREEELTDLRSTTVQRVARKFEADPAQAERISRVSRHLFVMASTALPPADSERFQRKLDWAAQLHEIGSQISHSDYHKHGAYILDNIDAPGFANPELHRLSLLVLGHRGKLRKLDVDFEDRVFVLQLLCLRLAVILCHARREPDLAGIELETGAQPGRLFVLNCPQEWAARFPQSAYLLQEEVVAWQKTPWVLILASP
ncbi:MAG: exopolyphosphatase [Polaromonas sp. 39-63-203]|jgi:exopolyphosphatase/guanosine-5'-triphosphate,3'-diphosphate pyrophosphatase|uniref:exopolyphosphatase n=1 Tax=Polaromonas sp. TaxID=1869339 RepID=UPI000BDDB523|nr:exopolyphosphatase [Polaromonas sp.]OYY53137.1 MAG: exopolyphosphatase [Polaromonas sp. 35-63-240]OYY99606.1 MAG: exopolyphosphatase [Polaromonas sp. 28-63-22]OYZ84278.1 MAG: exopolyphosphatase [Polaromonas sp. 24-62-144]OZA99548.1 MAG: exopolyphosphatase [Polaromonas sp. 39-63-203]HQS31210.1 exopolyphosphatase [Polaromonas sp.]